MLQSETVKKYDKYKDSGIEWIGEIPQHWEVRKLKTIGDYRNGLTYSPEDMCEEERGTLVLRSSNIKQGKLELNDNVYVNVEIPDNLKVKKGDILICSRNGSRELIGKNAIINDDINASFGAFMMILRCNCPKYMYYILNSYIFNYYLGSFFTSTINQLTGKNFGGMDIVFCPCSTEQEEIVNYLDKKSGEIDRVVETEKEVIEKLKEYKQSIITEAVTKGLDKSVPLKDSGIEWIGKIPQHWSITKLKYLSTSIGDGLHGTPKYSDIGDFYFINGNNVGDKHLLIKEDTNKLTKEEAENYFIELNNRTILISLNGTIGNTSRYNQEKIILSKSAGYINLEENINIDFIEFWLHSNCVKLAFELSFSGTTIKNLSLETLRNLYVILPLSKEQQQTAEYLNKKCSEIDKAIADKEQVIEKFTEYKKSLIYECVTGKRKVTI